jgi:RNA polymerase sigma-70 factor, ECF subfamily
MERSAELRSVDAELPDPFDAARQGSVEHLGALVAGLRDYLLLVANRELTAELRAKVSPSDVLQETFLIAQRKIASFEGKSDAELLAWLRAILLNKIQTVQQKFLGVQARDVRREVLIDFLSSSQNGLPADVDSPSCCAMAAERSATIDEILSHLPCEYEKVLMLRYWEQLSLEEIAQRMNRSTDAVQKLWFRAVERMKRELNRDERP